MHCHPLNDRKITSERSPQVTRQGHPKLDLLHKYDPDGRMLSCYRCDTQRGVTRSRRQAGGQAQTRTPPSHSSPRAERTQPEKTRPFSLPFVEKDAALA